MKQEDGTGYEGVYRAGYWLILTDSGLCAVESNGLEQSPEQAEWTGAECKTERIKCIGPV